VEHNYTQLQRFNAATHTYRCMYQRRTGLQQPYSCTLTLWIRLDYGLILLYGLNEDLSMKWMIIYLFEVDY
jgi:hypothetical protein